MEKFHKIPAVFLKYAIEEFYIRTVRCLETEGRHYQMQRKVFNAVIIFKGYF